MLGLGPIELGIVAVLGYLACKHLIARRFPGLRRALDIVFLLTVALMLAFGLISRLN
jgi:hypothetical protein